VNTANMTTDETQPNASDTVTEELTAYLDGELDEATQLAVENRLGEDPEYLQELQSLQRTWDTLDHLPMVDAGKSFTQTTMELIVDQAFVRWWTVRGRLCFSAIQ